MKVDPKKGNEKNALNLQLLSVYFFRFPMEGNTASVFEGCESLTKRIPFSILVDLLGCNDDDESLEAHILSLIFSPLPSSPSDRSVKNGMKKIKSSCGKRLCV